jgi:PLP dependent protein
VNNNPLQQVLHELRHKMNNASQAGGRTKPAQLLAVSKTKSAQAVRELAALGQKAFGENYVQEAIAKQHELSDLPLEWHLIGPLQSNKCAEAAQHFDWLHSLDRIKLIELLNRHRPAHLPPLNVLIQVNIDDEASKSGCAPNEIAGLAEAISHAPRLTLRGLMAIPEPVPDMEKRRSSFRKLMALFETLKQQYPSCDTLSMGMSDDFELAIKEGATMVRIGSALFGERNR